MGRTGRVGDAILHLALLVQIKIKSCRFGGI